jgi:large subunit ribosomal protein L32
MPQPKSRVTRSRRGMRRSHDALTAPTVHTCEATGELKRPHRAHKSADGSYYFKGKQISAAKFKVDASTEA